MAITADPDTLPSKEYVPVSVVPVLSQLTYLAALNQLTYVMGRFALLPELSITEYTYAPEIPDLLIPAIFISVDILTLYNPYGSVLATEFKNSVYCPIVTSA